MTLVVKPDPDAVARAAAAFISGLAREAVTARGRFVLAVSGGETPARMFHLLARERMPWTGVHLVQVDERVAPAGHPDRNLSGLQQSLLSHVPLPLRQVHPMPVQAPDLAAAMQQYAGDLREIAGTPPVLDLVHLGLGRDGHTASLVPGDPVLDVGDSDVALTRPYQGWRRMTLTYPIINRSRRIMWLVTGDAKAAAFARLYAGDAGIPAGRIDRERATIFADEAAAPA